MIALRAVAWIAGLAGAGLAQVPLEATARNGTRSTIESIRDLQQTMRQLGEALAKIEAGLPRRTPRRDLHEFLSGRKAERDAEFRRLSEGRIDMRKVRYESKVGRFSVPAYVFQPLEKRGSKGHAALVWVHGGVHGDMTPNYWPYIKHAIDRGYVVVCPEYRGSTGYGKAHYDAIDYGGHEVADAVSAVAWMRENLPHVDPNRIGMIGWSHGGLITLHGQFRNPRTFRAAVAIVPVTNLVFRLAYKGPRYQDYYTKQERIGGLPHEKRSVYIERSPVYHVDKLQTPLLVHLAKNDRDVNFVEAEMLVHALEQKKRDLVETRIYADPEGGHSFNRLVDREDPRKPRWTPESRDSWNRIWTFLEWHLRPYEGKRRR